MSSKNMQRFYGLHLIVIVCCFKIGLYQALSTTDRTTYHTSTAYTPAISSSAPITPDLTSDFQTSTAAEIPSTTESETCDNIGYVYNILSNNTYYNWFIGYHRNNWYNSSFWGGRVQIPWNENIHEKCSTRPYDNLAVLKDVHVDIADIGEDVITAEVCIWNQTDECIGNFTVEMRTCSGHLLYRFTWDYLPNTHICFDRVYTDSCQSSGFVYSAGNVTDRFLTLTYPDVQFGWLDAHQNGKQYVLPAFDDVDEVYEEFIGINNQYREQYFLKERMSLDIPENIPVKYKLCFVYKYINNDDNYFDDEYYYEEYCTNYVYARICDGKILFDVSYFRYFTHLCLIEQCEGNTRNKKQRRQISCNDDDIGLSSAAHIGIIVGSVFVGIIATAAVVSIVLRCYKVTKNRRTVPVGDMNSSQAYLSAGPARETWGGDKH